LYFLAVGHYKLGNYQEAKRYNGKLDSFSLSTTRKNERADERGSGVGLLLEKEPNNFQSKSLNALIEKAVAKGESQESLSDDIDVKKILSS